MQIKIEHQIKTQKERAHHIEQIRIATHRLNELISTTVALSSETQEILLNQCFGNLADCYAVEFGNNLAIYAGHLLSLSSQYRYIGLKLLLNLHKSCLRAEKRYLGFDNIQHFISSVPFLKESDSHTEDLILSSFESLSISNAIKDVDIASHGRVLTLPESQFAEGTVKATWQWLSNDLGLSPSKPFYSL